MATINLLRQNQNFAFVQSFYAMNACSFQSVPDEILQALIHQHENAINVDRSEKYGLQVCRLHKPFKNWS
jgi:hypothetical protein